MTKRSKVGLSLGLAAGLFAAALVVTQLPFSDPAPNKRRVEAEQLLTVARDDIRAHHRKHGSLPDAKELADDLESRFRLSYSLLAPEFEDMGDGVLRISTRPSSGHKAFGRLTFVVATTEDGEFAWITREDDPR